MPWFRSHLRLLAYWRLTLLFLSRSSILQNSNQPLSITTLSSIPHYPMFPNLQYRNLLTSNHPILQNHALRGGALCMRRFAQYRYVQWEVCNCGRVPQPSL
ncbi:hypothetical protein DFH08DRAFT_889125 [Mycena albidolilacea]|uniref:Secreted protein n=1 Tax=Mycena albidolilacea TaxID=1033008 RepID=A0AAD6ZGF4_9AGAR|nr:hypothetical protein DFH08DRAFT_889125 [Mycena albidolilacea]